MSFTAQQNLRQSLLLKALELNGDPEEALKIAAVFERYVLEGSVNVANSQLTKANFVDSSVTEKASEIAAPKDTQIQKTQTVTTSHQIEGSNEPRQLKRPRWSSNEEERLTALWADGIPIKEIAGHLGRTPASINGRVRQLKLPNRLNRKDSSGRKATLGSAANEESDSSKKGKGLATPLSSKQPKSSSKQPKSGAIRRGWAKRRKRNNSDRESKAAKEERASAVARHIEQFGMTKIPLNLDTVVTFLRSRDYSIVRTDDGSFLLDEREVLSSTDLLHRANVVRERLGQSAFPDQILASSEDSREQTATVA